MDNPETVRKLNHLPVRERIRDVFVDAILRLQVAEDPYQLVERFVVSKTEPFHTSEPVYAARKTVYESLPYPKRSEYEKHVMRYLDEQKEVLAYTKVFTRMPLRIPYHDADGHLRHYIPDFVAKAKDGYYLIETKGKGWDEQITAQAKAAAANEWCEKVTELTGEKWTFVKIVDADFQRFRPLSFGKLVQAVSSEGKP